MAIRVVRLGSPRASDEGLRIGTVRHPPRGVRKEDYASRDFYDVWFPNLSPSESLIKEFRANNDDGGWKTFKRHFLAEMKERSEERRVGKEGRYGWTQEEKKKKNEKRGAE